MVPASLEKQLHLKDFLYYIFFLVLIFIAGAFLLSEPGEKPKKINIPNVESSSSGNLNLK